MMEAKSVAWMVDYGEAHLASLMGLVKAAMMVVRMVLELAGYWV